MWTYQQSTGELADDFGEVFYGYSGFGEGKNNPALQGVVDVGPIPRGFYHISEPLCVDFAGPHGPFVLHLTPQAGTDTHGRDGFLMHGDSSEHPGAASHGCIIAALPVRKRVAASGDALLKVIA